MLIGETLGEGAFGVVLKAEAQGLTHKTEKKYVAVKMLKGKHQSVSPPVGQSLQSMGRSVDRSVGQSVGHCIPVSQSASQPLQPVSHYSQSATTASQPLQPVSHYSQSATTASPPVSQSTTQPVSQSATQPVSQSASQSVSQSVSQSAPFFVILKI